jgi:hypothetical protein
MISIRVKYEGDDPVVIHALELVQWAINEPEFWDYILNFTNHYGRRHFLQTKETNARVLERLINGAERRSEADNGWDFVVRRFDSGGSLVAFVEEDGNTIYMNSEYMDRSIAEICNTLVHEYCHLVGLTHSFFDPGRDIWTQTAPYAIGQYVQYMVERRLGIESKPPFFPKASLGRRVVYKLKKLFRTCS